MSLRKIAKILGISPTYLSLLLNGKRPWRGNVKERYEELVNTFVNTNGGQSEIEDERNSHSIPKMMVGRQGFEPWTLGLKVRCSNQAELPARAAGIVGAARLDSPNLSEIRELLTSPV